MAIQVIDPTRCFLPAADIITASSPYADAKDAGEIPDEFQGHLSAYVDTYCRTTSNYETAQGATNIFIIINLIWSKLFYVITPSICHPFHHHHFHFR